MHFGSAAVVSVGCAVASFPCLALERRARAGLLLVLSIPIALAPCLVPADEKLLRFAAALLSLVLLLKLYDLHVSAENGDRLGFAEFLAWLGNWFSLVHRQLAAEPRRTTSENWRLVLSGAAGTGAGTLLLAGAFGVDWSAFAFPLEHTAKVPTFFLAVVSAASALSAGYRLLGGRARDYMDHPFIAATPADFWRRYNRVAQQFFYEDVYKRVGGLRRPIPAALVTFTVSALLHEYLFSMAVGRVQGYQTAFFLLHGIAVAATWHVRPTGWAAVPAIAATLAFNLASSVLFFASVNELLPFYSRWLPG